MADAAKAKPARGDLTQGHIGSTLLKFALPTLISSILQSLNGTINAIWVGRFLGENALAATSNANMIMFLLMSFVLDSGLNPVFILGLGPAPKLGIAGSATATLVANMVSFVALLIYIYVRDLP